LKFAISSINPDATESVLTTQPLYSHKFKPAKEKITSDKLERVAQWVETFSGIDFDADFCLKLTWFSGNYDLF
jgi:hypothetical protein